MSVSDRLDAGEGWRRYGVALGRLVAGAAGVLAPDGCVLLTFNNHDLRAWRALIEALHAQRLGCDEVSYQIPAVVSSKAAFHPERSYVGDLWAVCRRRPEGWTPARDVTPAVAALVRCASSRDGRIAPKLARRTLAIAWMTHDLAAELTEGWEALLDDLFTRASDGVLTLKGAADGGPRLAALARAAAREALAEGPCTWAALYEVVAGRCAGFGLPDPGELRRVLDGVVDVRGRRCVALPGLARAE